MSDDTETLAEVLAVTLAPHEANLRLLWRDLAREGIELGTDWPYIARTLFADMDRLAARIVQAREDGIDRAVPSDPSGPASQIPTNAGEGVEHDEWCPENGCRCGKCGPCIGPPLCKPAGEGALRKRIEWRVLHNGGVDSAVRYCGTDERNARESARIWGGTVQSRTVTETEWALTDTAGGST